MCTFNIVLGLRTYTVHSMYVAVLLYYAMYVLFVQYIVQRTSSTVTLHLRVYTVFLYAPMYVRFMGTKDIQS